MEQFGQSSGIELSVVGIGSLQYGHSPLPKHLWKNKNPGQPQYAQTF